jgi:hypothetical protein
MIIEKAVDASETDVPEASTIFVLAILHADVYSSAHARLSSTRDMELTRLLPISRKLISHRHMLDYYDGNSQCGERITQDIPRRYSFRPRRKIYVDPQTNRIFL